MADGDVLIDTEFELEDPPGWEIEMFACEDSTRPSDIKYRFQCYDPETGDTILRYDNSPHHPEAGRHHRHTSEDRDPDGIAFNGLHEHIQRFQNEVRSIHD